MAVCVLTRALQWWLRLLGVFPVSDSEPGSVVGPITGDPDPVTPSRDRVVPVCNRDLIPADSPAHCLGRTASQTGQWPWQGCLRAQHKQAGNSPRCADQEALPTPPGIAENQAESGVLPGPPSWLGGGSLQPPIPGSGTPSPRNRRRAILRAGRVCFWLGASLVA